MPYRISSDKDSQIIYLTFTGILTKEIAIESRKELAEFIQKTGVKKVLVEQSEAILDATVIDIYNFHSSHNGLIPYSVKIALVSSLQSLNITEAHFAENVARNRGVNMKFFTIHYEGVKWLLSSDD